MATTTTLPTAKDPSSSMSTSPSLAFVTHNNRGLTFLKNGDIGQARKCFTDALRGAQLDLVQESSGTNNDEEEEEEQSPQPSQTTSAIRDQLFTRLRALPTSALQEQALSIAMDTSQLSSANLALIYAVIIYNMGLVYHVRGRECRSSCALEKATELYEKALSIVMLELESTAPASSSRNPIVDLLRMALLKHLADIQCSLSNHQLARALGDELLGFITSVGCFSYRDSRVTELMQAQVGCFLTYSFSLIQGSLLAPAA
jgi:tetratricopeptide (TPR) repeat protein